MDDDKNVREAAAEDMSYELLTTLLMQVRMLPKPWDQMPKVKQDEVIESFKKAIRTSVNDAVKLIASNDRVTVEGELEQVTIKDGVKAQITVSKSAENLSELFEAVGSPVLIVCADNPVYDRGLDDVEGEDDQRSLELGQEYRD